MTFVSEAVHGQARKYCVPEIKLTAGFARIPTMILSASCSALSSATRLGNVKKLRPNVRQDATRRAQVAVRAYTITLKFPDEEDKVVEVDGDSLDNVGRFTVPFSVAISGLGLGAKSARFCIEPSVHSPVFSHVSNLHFALATSYVD